MCTQARLPDLWSDLQWTLQHSGWQQPHAQHDVAEYLAFARRFIIPDLLAGGWQSRLAVHPEASSQPDVIRPLGFQVRDRGVSWPLYIPEPPARPAVHVDGRLSIQRLIHCWNHQAFDGATALFCEPQVLAVQVNRFCDVGPSALHKDETPIIPDPRILIPAFCSDAANYDSALSTQLCTCALRAIIAHLGDVPTSGHYRAFLFSHELEPRHRFCDDAKSPVYHDAVPELAQRFGYVYLYQHD
eukprot:s341_g33.t1